MALSHNQSRVDRVKTLAEPLCRIAVFGDVMVDYVVELDSLSSKDEKISAAYSHRRLGGTGANAAAILTQLSNVVNLIATVSDDAMGDWLIRELKAEQIGVEHVAKVQGAVPHATILLASNGRQVIVDRGVTDQVKIPGKEWIDTHDLLFVSNPVAVLPKLPRDLEGLLVVAVEHQMYEQLLDDVDHLLTADVIITNEAGWNTFADVLADGPVVVETRGASGLVIHESSQDLAIAAIPVVSRDETGAGDAFAGAFCHYLARKSGIRAATEHAIAAASLAIASGRPLRAAFGEAEVEALWHEHFESFKDANLVQGSLSTDHSRDKRH